MTHPLLLRQVRIPPPSTLLSSLRSHLFADSPRAYKRQRITSESTNTPGSTSLSIGRTPYAQGPSTDNMHIPRSDKMSTSSPSVHPISEAGPSSITLDKTSRPNGITSINGFKPNGSLLSNGVPKQHSSSVARVSLPGTTLYDDPYVDREEFVRLVIQSLRDVGYM